MKRRLIYEEVRRNIPTIYIVTDSDNELDDLEATFEVCHDLCHDFCKENIGQDRKTMKICMNACLDKCIPPLIKTTLDPYADTFIAR